MAISVGKVNTGYDSSLYVTSEVAVKKYGVNEKDLETLDKDGDGKVTLSELTNAGVSKYQQLGNFFNEKTNGALFASLGVEKTSGVQPVQQPQNVYNKDNFLKNTFNFKANPNRPEHRDYANAELLGDAVQGKNLYAIG